MQAAALLTASPEEIEAYAREFDLDAIVERERANGVLCGPGHRKWLLENRAPASVLEHIERGRQRPELVAVKGTFTGMELQDFPPANLRAAIASTTTETNLWDPGLWALIPKLSMAAGRTYRVEFGGIMGTTSTPTISWTTRIGTNNSAPPTGTTLNAGPTVTLGTFAAQPFYGILTVGVRSIGVAASGATLTGNGFVVMPAAAAATVTPVAQLGGAIPTTIDHTVDQGIGVSIIWGASSASNTLTPQWMTFVSLN